MYLINICTFDKDLLIYPKDIKNKVAKKSTKVTSTPEFSQAFTFHMEGYTFKSFYRHILFVVRQRLVRHLQVTMRWINEERGQGALNQILTRSKHYSHKTVIYLRRMHGSVSGLF